MKETEKIIQGHKMDIPYGDAIVTHQYLIIGDDVICTDIFIEPIDCDYIIKIHANTFLGTVQEAMEDYHKYVEGNFLPDGMSTDELVDFLLQDMED